MAKLSPTPIVLVTADVKPSEGYEWHATIAHYLSAVLNVAGAVPLILPSLGERLPLKKLLQRIDGVLVTGSRSNVHPRHYGEVPSAAAEPYDEQRDATTLPLIRAAINAGVPLLCICRGIQELNVALGGTLHVNIHNVEGRVTHRQSGSDDNKDRLFAINHEITFSHDAHLATLAKGRKALTNSVHFQAIKDLADGLEVEATAADGTIEAVRVAHADGFAFGVQWHPEYWSNDDPFSREIFIAFGKAVQTQADRPGRQ